MQMAKTPRKSVSIKDLPPPKGFIIIGGAGKRTDDKEENKEAQPKTAPLST
jgi:hypothetical protein